MKAPDGKYDLKQVCDVIFKMAMNPELGRRAVLSILEQFGGGVKNVASLKPENFDKVYEACRNLLAGGASADPIRSRTGFISEDK